MAGRRVGSKQRWLKVVQYKHYCYNDHPRQTINLMLTVRIVAALIDAVFAVVGNTRTLCSSIITTKRSRDLQDLAPASSPPEPHGGGGGDVRGRAATATKTSLGFASWT